MIELIGWLGSICFALCAAPEAYNAWIRGNAGTVSRVFLWIWLTGELLTTIYIPNKHGWDWPIMTNLSLNIFFILVILRYVYFPRRR